jgi:hypothetical protein
MFARRSGDVGDNKSVVNAIAASKLNTVVGPIAWDGKNLPPFAQKNIAKTPLVGVSGGYATAANTTSSSPTTRSRQKFRLAARWNR